MYGTAWKEEQTEDLVRDALQVGFRAIDTANQRKHYFEEAVGNALKRFLAETDLTREDIFLQTKYTFQSSQDDRLPYDPAAPISEQVEQSVEKSKVHLGIEQIDSLLLHGPSHRFGLHDSDWEAYTSMERLANAGHIRHLGVSNFNAGQLKALLDDAQVKPSFVQNRCYTIFNWDEEVREVCKSEGITYQGFSLLTANAHFMQHPIVQDMAQATRKWPAQIVFRYCMDLGMLPITGTGNRRHMAGDLECLDFELTDSQRVNLAQLSRSLADTFRRGG
jgi:diketogulonate reductase-like aldo/keto reductase